MRKLGFECVNVSLVIPHLPDCLELILLLEK
jgi:hypothetical protein